MRIGDWGLKLGIKITIFKFGYWEFGNRNEDWDLDWRLGLGLVSQTGMKICIGDWDWGLVGVWDWGMGISIGDWDHDWRLVFGLAIDFEDGVWGFE